MLLSLSAKSTFRILSIIMVASTVSIYSLLFYFQPSLDLRFVEPFLAIQLAVGLTAVVVSHYKYYKGLRFQYVIVLSALATTIVFISIVSFGIGFNNAALDKVMCLENPTANEPQCIEMLERISQENEQLSILVYIGLVWVGGAILYLRKLLSLM